MPNNFVNLPFILQGDVPHIEVLGQHVIVLNSVKTAMELLDKKSSVYSDRPVLPMCGELVGWKRSLGFLSHGDRFRCYRKNMHRVIGSRTAMEVYNPLEEVETHRFLKRVLAKPEQLQAHIRHAAGAIILRISYGYDVEENDDPFVDLADRGVDQLSRSTAPSCLHVAQVPEWFPGAGFKRLAREWRQTLDEMVDAPYKFVDDQMAAGIAPASFTSNLLEVSALSAEEDRNVKRSALSLYGGSDAKKAQAEIDAIVGTDRLPSFADRDSLPYIEALVKEILRWNVVAPTGVMHCVSEDDIHAGHYIPKGSVVIPNVWFMLHDPRTYANSSQFRPEHFLDNDGKDPEPEPRTICFGFGLHLADASVWIFAVMSLAAFDISKAVENGVEITPEVDPSTGTISHSKPFKRSIKPRSAKAVALIQQDVNY
ncbi:cytochrome P450 [Suillus plorans]|uniref:Cytochrome P450 n=1 Tax=Suillus plorans TaxID=116603 RepID=A0A9P7DBA3_9AGAM|nr:cytochrome P450 [Suillus plorans]KAG1785476.1 cytochrome P450 [Suillus plorans]